MTAKADRTDQVGLSRVVKARIRVVQSPSDDGHYRALSQDALACGDRTLAATAYTQWLVCIGVLTKDASEVLANRWFLQYSRYFQFYFSILASRGQTSTDDFLLERRIASGGPLSRERRLAALQSFTQPSPVEIDRAAVLVCGMPKSASTFVSRCLTNYLDLRMVTPHNINDGLGTGFDFMRFLRANRRGVVLHSHFAANARILTMLRIFECRPVVTVRNIFDALRSYADHIAEPWVVANPAAGPRPDWNTLAILKIAAFYVDFYAAWQRAVGSGYPVTFVHFTEVKHDAVGVLKQCLTHLGETFDLERAEAVIRGINEASEQPDQRSAIKLNVGISGRGADFGVQDRAYVRALYSAYPDVDFTDIDPDQ